MNSLLCKCGCKGQAEWLLTGEDYTGEVFTDEPACTSVALYCEEAAAELGKRFTKRPIDSAGVAHE